MIIVNKNNFLYGCWDDYICDHETRLSNDNNK